MCLKKLREKFKNRKYLFIPRGKSNLTNYDKGLLCAISFAHFGITVLAVMLMGLYFNNRTEAHKTMSARCGLMNQILKADARLDSEIEMRKARNSMQGDSIDVKIEPPENKGRPLLELLKEYKQKFN